MFYAAMREKVTLAGAAAGALAIGLVVYLADRPVGSAWLLPWAGLLQAHPGAANLAPWLPTAVHAFAFALLSALVLPPRRSLRTLACAGWVLADLLFELGQHPALAAPLSQGLEALLPAALAAPLARYFQAGTFDGADLGAALLGGMAAWLLLRGTETAAEIGHGA